MSIKNQVAHTLIETAKATAEAMGNHGHRLNALEAQLSHLTRPNPSLDLGKLADQPKEVNGEVEKLKATSGRRGYTQCRMILKTNYWSVSVFMLKLATAIR